MKTKIILLLTISALFAGCVQEEADEKFTVVEIMNESCTADSECVTPEGYLARSVCPYTSKCIDNQCTVICPEGWMVGGERDEHGCLGPAGYAWDEDIGSCTREWELDEGQRRAAKIAVAPLSYSVTVVEVDASGCPTCFSVHLQRNDNQEELTINLANWEIVEELVGCPEDARVCPDGSVVVREGPDCKFAPCPSQEMTEELCSSAGGNWNECSSRCQLENQGRSDVACAMMCESLCECAGFAGFACPEGYTCRTPSRIADALGYCVKAKSEGMTIEEALEIAEKSECTGLTDDYFYNENTRTWWIDLDLEKEGCNPACVVREDAETAEINWRCTGLLTPS